MVRTVLTILKQGKLTKLSPGLTSIPELGWPLNRSNFSPLRAVHAGQSNTRVVLLNDTCLKHASRHTSHMHSWLTAYIGCRVLTVFEDKMEVPWRSYSMLATVAGQNRKLQTGRQLRNAADPRWGHSATQNMRPARVVLQAVKNYVSQDFPWENKVRCLSMLAMEIQNAMRMEGHKGVMKKSRVSASSHSP